MQHLDRQDCKADVVRQNQWSSKITGAVLLNRIPPRPKQPGLKATAPDLSTAIRIQPPTFMSSLDNETHGYATDDGVGLHYVGKELAEAVSTAQGVAAYWVEPDSTGRAVDRRVPTRPIT